MGHLAHMWTLPLPFSVCEKKATTNSLFAINIISCPISRPYLQIKIFHPSGGLSPISILRVLYYTDLSIVTRMRV